MPTSIHFAGLEVSFLQDRHGTANSLDLFTTTAHPGAGMPIPHYHEGWDETVYGLFGTIVWTIAGQEVAVGPGASAFITRGVVHGFANRSDAPATFLSVLTPGILGLEYFQETVDLLNAGRPDPEAMHALMRRHGLVPVLA